MKQIMQMKTTELRIPSGGRQAAILPQRYVFGSLWSSDQSSMAVTQSYDNLFFQLY